jgi:hypothetical protein
MKVALSSFEPTLQYANASKFTEIESSQDGLPAFVL